MDHELLHLWNDYLLGPYLDLAFKELFTILAWLEWSEICCHDRFKNATILCDWVSCFSSLRIHCEKVTGKLICLHCFQTKDLYKACIVLTMMSQGNFLQHDFYDLNLFIILECVRWKHYRRLPALRQPHECMLSNQHLLWTLPSFVSLVLRCSQARLPTRFVVLVTDE